MTVKFEKELALEVGVNGALVYECIRTQCKESCLDRKNYHRGFYWMRASVREFHEKLPYLSPAEIRTALRDLLAKKVIITDNFGGSRAGWYAVLR